MRRTGQCSLDIAFADRKSADQVRLTPLMDDSAVAAQRGLGVDNDRQLFEVPVDQFGGVLRLVAAFRDNDHERLTHMAHLVMCQ